MTQTVLLGDTCSYVTEKVAVESVALIDYVSTENLIADKGGLSIASNLPKVGRVTSFQKGDVLISNIRPYFKKIWFANRDGGASNDVLVFRSATSKLLNAYLYYLLKDDMFFHFSTASAGGSKMPRGDKAHILKYPVYLPDLETQKKIVEILGKIDEKIELNRKVNETLEQMGQALLRHYFMNNLEEDSATLSIGDVAQVIDCLHSKKPERAEVSTGNILLQLNNIKDDGTLDLTEKYWISDVDYQKWISRLEATENDFVITNVGRSGAVAKIPEGIKAAMGRNMTAIRLKEELNAPGFMSFLLNSSYMKQQIESRLDHGTILSALNVKNIPKLTLPASDKELILKHEKEFISLRHKIEVNVEEIQTLTTLRDTLLPRLISGKMKV